MYKGTSRSLKHRHIAAEVRAASTVFICPDDFNKPALDMTLDECIAERATVLKQKAQAENQLQAAKRSSRMGRQHSIGMVISGHCTRLSEINDRIKQLGRSRNLDELKAFRSAAESVLSADDLARVCERTEAILAEWAAKQ
jgi:hypothetical protein